MNTRQKAEPVSTLPARFRRCPQAFARFVICALLLGTGARAQAAASDEDWPTRLRQYQITPLVPPAPARDFALQDLQGREIRLQSLRGDWVLLTFFATWCGPCASEMPSLEALFLQGRSGKHRNKVHIFGVATDPENDVRGFAQQHGMTFGVLLDSQGIASRMYQASSIPTSFLIDPGGQVVGTTRGARDWRRAGALFDALPTQAVSAPASDHAATDHAINTPRATPPPVALPADVMPPSATASVRGIPRIDAPFILDVQVTWTGKSSDYVLLPPQVHTPEAVEVMSVAAHTGSTAGAAQINYEIKLVAHKTGAFALDPIDIRYTPAGGQEPLTTRLMGPTVQVDFAGWRRLWEHHRTSLVAGLAAVGVAAGAVGVRRFWLRRRRTLHEVAEPPEAQRYTDAQAQLERVQHSRMSGNVPAFLHQLMQIAPELDPPHQRKTLQALAEAATYGNMRPDEEVLNQLERQAVRKVQALAPTPLARAEQGQT